MPAEERAAQQPSVGSHGAWLQAAADSGAGDAAKGSEVLQQQVGEAEGIKQGTGEGCPGFCNKRIRQQQ